MPSVEVAAVEDVLLWKEPWLTAKVLSLGLYILICLRQLVSGSYSCAMLPRSMLSTIGQAGNEHGLPTRSRQALPSQVALICTSAGNM